MVSQIAIPLLEAQLSSVDLLGHALQGNVYNFKDLQSFVFVSTRRRTGRLPDYVYNNAEDLEYRGAKTVAARLERALKRLADCFLLIDSGRPLVKKSRFQEWQNLLCKVPPLPLTAAALVQDAATKGAKPWDSVLRAVKHASYPAIADPVLLDRLGGDVFTEPHMHLNGASDSSTVWLDALRRPHLVAKSLKKAFKHRIREQLAQIAPFLGTAIDLYRMLCIASWLRSACIVHLFQTAGHVPENVRLSRDNLARNLALWRTAPELTAHAHLAQRLLVRNSRQLNAPSSEQGLGACASLTELGLETLFLTRAIYHLPQAGDNFAVAFHCYLLIHSCFNRLLVQQLEQNGFDQFQRIADNKLRDPSESTYEKRFRQVLESLPGNERHIEGRFAPKTNTAKTAWLLHQIIAGWEKATREKPQDSRQNLILTAHFIKKEDKELKAEALPFCRHNFLRRQTNRMARSLVVLRRSHVKKLGNILFSVDAAANELHAPPEVYAPTFRFLRQKGFTSFTYHVGEDFVHLLSGLRAVYEALLFLDLRHGDRIGHGTAVAIDPELWQQRLGKSVVMSKQDRLDDLLFAYYLLTSSAKLAEHAHIVPLLGRFAKDLATEIHGPSVTIPDCIAAWKLRKYDPEVVFANHPSIIPSKQKEIEEYSNNTEGERDLYKRYHQNLKSREAGKVLIEVDTDSLPVELFHVLQAHIVNELRERHVAMEIMPTSNVRISYYHSCDEHHVIRLLGAGPSPMPTHPALCLASDDPGIFATTLQNEYTHVYLSLCKNQIPEQEALAHMENMKRMAWSYRFRMKNINQAPNNDAIQAIEH